MPIITFLNFFVAPYLQKYVFLFVLALTIDAKSELCGFIPPPIYVRCSVFLQIFKFGHRNYVNGKRNQFFL